MTGFTRISVPGRATGGAARQAALAEAATAADATRGIEIAQTVLTGLLLAFIFRAFLVEAFIIPTGSMAESLLGAHATQLCPACGWEFEFGSLGPTSPTGAGFLYPGTVTCPNCQSVLAPAMGAAAPKPGDRVLVHKWSSAVGGLFSPRRWDVIVFRDPANPEQHYIKRLVGLPGESVEIVGGDVFINGRIARKPRHVQRVLWSVVYDQAHCPAAQGGALPRPRWIAHGPAGGTAGGWSGLDRRVLRCDASDGGSYVLDFNPDSAREYLRDFYAYNRGSSGAFVGDIRICGEITFEGDGRDGRFQLELLRTPSLVTAELHRDGRVRLLIDPVAGATGSQLHMTAGHGALAGRRPIRFELGHVDYRVYLSLGGRVVLETRDQDYSPELEGLQRMDDGQYPVGVRLVASGICARVERVRIDRDVHYLASPPRSRRAYPDHPFVLGGDEYFVLGDNSPDSHDSREWTEAGPHLGPDYRVGTVPAAQVVGQAAFVYLPGLLPVSPGGVMRIPDLGRVRFIR